MSADERTRPRREERQPALSRALIVAAAVRLLDAEGIEELSMRKLGTGMGAAATSLYRHVTGKDELIELVLDEVYGELEVPGAASAAEWRDAVSRGGHDLRAMALRHPWVASVIGRVGPARLGPNLTRATDRMRALLRTGGFPADEAELAMRAVVSYVVGATTGEAAHLSRLARSGRSERSEQEWREGRDPRKVREENFDYGLQRVLDGLETRLSRA
ncbi:TetR/AcrR family transcriptional regulator [Streptomyces virginiae]|uniref:TetR/AcrR family transcriptional regulator n=1 Tax=Streptomyces virginiae TaxID=1961 RepID=UPI002258DBFE|nr:TetR/AcrR family transcriptional regulator [Streptomyces virginiae]MCX4718417.1 TetR/AcrR family transcriptional regulator [Streptomyces virginiae]MCX5275103.1 TetR/AcrR family transcriptional regulator [Streptomyces virginiae]